MTPGATMGEPMISPRSIRRRDVGDPRHGRDHRLLKLRLWMLAIVDQIEAVGDFTGHVRHAVTGGERRAKLGFIGIRGFMQIDMHQHAIAEGRDEAHEGGRLWSRDYRRETSGSGRSR